MASFALLRSLRRCYSDLHKDYNFRNEFNGEAKAKTGLVLPSSVLMGKKWVFVKKQRVIIVMPSLPLPEPSFTLDCCC